MAPNEPQSLDDLAPDGLTQLAAPRHLLRTDRHQGDRRCDERDRVDEDRERCADDLDERPGETGPADLGHRRALRQLRVPFEQAFDADEGRQV